MPVKKEILQQTLESAFPGSEVKLVALTGDDDHWEVIVKSDQFKEKSRLDQQRMVSNAVKELNIHALSIKTLS